MLSESAAKRSVELAWLAYTPVWGLACAVVMIGGFAEGWGDAALMAFGATLGIGALALPIVLRPAEERARPLADTTAVKLGASVVGFAFLYNWLQTPFFFDVLHMHYGFRSTWNVESNPLFLYLLTIAYFATYSVLVMGAYRATRRALARWPIAGRAVGALVAPFGVAFLETALNANPWMRSLFCYDDPALALGVGSLAYGLAFSSRSRCGSRSTRPRARASRSRGCSSSRWSRSSWTRSRSTSCACTSRRTSPPWSTARWACATSERAASRLRDD